MTATETQHNATPKRRRARWERAFLSSMQENGNVSLACEAAGIERSTAYRARERFEEFAIEWDTALEIAADALEAEARRRAVSGTDKPVFFRGEECGVIREYSDSLLMFLLKAARPEKYRERHEVTGKGGGPLVITSIVAVKPEDAP